MKTFAAILTAAFEFATDVFFSSLLGTIAGAATMAAAPALAYPVAFVVSVSAMTYLAIREVETDY